ncbi:hypothetical protein KAMIYU_97 [Mycobacterium phage Kamiyu]|uniref:DUF945 domain-containing protein n=2 Tax=Pipefishvirus TaxID=1982899 RepID=V5R916_9CAUD|nr:hypothetical protein X818_gp094 [Mycobacterium phage Bernardo]YP_009018608.1 hypothetical protein CM10_gp098 [Mycobacterium phage Akoma]AER50228.1 hypothetical protein KAMIYU_97 [Mycobacterium phage Kamiyu]AHN84005.1 hypothetical protein AUDREY_97 [Mycobacterium phage Audrey]AHN84313.1 hypothetical protein HEATHCLIFF_97 [Mycobacterium phage Heathcliff]QAY13712.1 hypothetical protein SEA_ROMAT_97 [Mycobacterium phage RomaT]QFG13859.1 hypothetical protein PHILLY_96 [Mycobacterium phage Phill
MNRVARRDGPATRRKESTMAHEIDTTDGVSSFADSRVSANGKVDAWHKLGQAVGHAMTADEFLDAAHMRGWDVRKIPLQANLSEGGDDETEMVDIPGKFVTVRTNPINGKVEPLGVVGSFWTPFQNEWTTKLLFDITDESGAVIETGGSLDGGRRTFVTMKMPDHMELVSPITGKRDVTDLYLSIFNHHDGGGSLVANISPVRVVCANTQRMAERAAVSRVSIRHTGEAQVRLEEVRRILGLTWKYQDTYVAEVEEMAKIEMSNVETFAIMRSVFEVDKVDPESRSASQRTQMATEAFEIYRSSATVDDFRGVAFGGYNAVTEWVDHYMPVRGKDNVDVKRALRTINGGGGEIKARAWEAFRNPKALIDA